MKRTTRLAAVLTSALALTAGLAAAAGKDTMTDSLHAFTMKSIDGKEKPLADYKGKAVLVVNTASQCGYTPQYAGLEELYQKYKDRGFVVLAFPANEFGGQEPGSDPEIKKFCTMKYKTTFDLFSKIVVKGDGIHPLYKWLTTRPGYSGDIKWNFNKFLVDGNGAVVARFDSGVTPMSPELTGKLEAVLPKR